MKPLSVTMPSPLANSPKTPSGFDQGQLTINISLSKIRITLYLIQF